MKSSSFFSAVIFFFLWSCQKPDPIIPITIPVIPPVSPPVAKIWVVSTFAGNGVSDGFNGNSTISPVYNPTDIVTDNKGNFYFSDYNRIRKIDSFGVITTLAGNGKRGYLDTIGSAAEFSPTAGIDIDQQGNIFVTDRDNCRIRKVTPNGLVSTYAGGGSPGFADGPAKTARFSSPEDIAIDISGNIYVADVYNHRIRKITPGGVVSTLAGNGIRGYKDGAGDIAQFYMPRGVAVDLNGNVYVADETNNRIRKITPSGFVTTIAGSFNGYKDGNGTNTWFASPIGVAVDSSASVFVSDVSNGLIRKITADGTVSTLAGVARETGFMDGAALSAKFNFSAYLMVDKKGDVYVADRGNNRIRKISKQ